MSLAKTFASVILDERQPSAERAPTPLSDPAKPERGPFDKSERTDNVKKAKKRERRAITQENTKSKERSAINDERTNEEERSAITHEGTNQGERSAIGHESTRSLERNGQFEAIARLDKDLKIAARTLGKGAARFLVDRYYQVQNRRIRDAGQIRSARGEPNRLLKWMFDSDRFLESDILRALDVFSDEYRVGRWLKCSPPDSLVRTTFRGDVPISELKNGDQVFAYHRKKSQISGKRLAYGHAVEVACRPYSGQMTSILCSGKETRTTPNHKWPVHIDPDLTCNKFVVYLMRRGFVFRIGRSRLLVHRVGHKQGRLGVTARARMEKADGLWILKMFDVESEASIYENYAAAFYGIPTATFEPPNSKNTFLTRENLAILWGMFHPAKLLTAATACLIDHGKDIRFPLYSKGTQAKPNARHLLDVHAVNLIPEIMQLPTIAHGSHTKFAKFEMESKWYDGQVYSLDVQKHHTYIQDGLCTCNSITGIGPVITAGLLAHLDITQAPTAGHFWRFAGLDPTCKWEKKTKRPWNAGLKVLVAFKAGESFVKTQNNKNDYYGQIFVTRKALEHERNERLLFNEQAEQVLAAKRIGKDTEAFKAYSVGKLPPAHIHARARRYAAKLFLAHVHQAMYADWYKGAPSPLPYIFHVEEGRHRHLLEPPNWPMPKEGKSLREMGA